MVQSRSPGQQDEPAKAGENSVDVLIRRFKSGDEEVLYEKIKSAADLALDSLDGNTGLAKCSVSGLPVPHFSVEERLKPLNPFYVDKSKRKKFIPNICSSTESSVFVRQSSSDKAMEEAKLLRQNRAALKAAADKQVLTAVKKNSSEKAIRKHTSSMPVSYNSFIASTLIRSPN